MNLPNSLDTIAPATAPRDRQAIAARYAALPADKRGLFRARLAEMNLDAGQLPIVPLCARAPDGSTTAPLSPMQAQLWFLAQLDGDSSAYHINGGLRLQGPLDRQRLLDSVANLGRRHETLRTRIVAVEGEPVQVIDGFDAQAAAPCQLFDLRDASGVAAPAAIEGLAQAFALRRFDLAREPLWRVALVTVGEDDHVLLLTLHHLISDGFSMAVLVQDFASEYRQPVRAPVPGVQFADWVQWTHDWRDPAAEQADLAYWRQRLGDPLEPLSLPLDRPRSASRSGHGARLVRTLSAGQLGDLRGLVKARRSTVTAVLLAVYQLLLSRYSGQPVVRVGMPLANRDRSETRDLIGCFVNTVVIESRLDGAAPFSAQLGQVQQRLGEALSHGAVSFAQVVDTLRPAPLPGVTPLFQAMFNLLEVAGSGLPQLPGLRVSEWSAEHPVARHDLTLDVRDHGQQVTCAFIYATDLFDSATAANLVDDYFTLLQQVLADSDSALGNLALGRTAVPTPVLPAPAWPFVSLLDRLLAQVAKAPQATAVVAGEVRLDYQQLATAALDLAARLQAAGVVAEERVGVCVQRSAQLPVALYGVLASGAAYVPLDPQYPAERLQFILADAGITRVVTDADSLARHAGLLAQVQCLPAHSTTTDRPLHRPELYPEQLAYVIYTSGSTGQPKGVGVTQHNVARLLDSTARIFGFDHRDVWSCFHSYAFDFSVWELFGALSFGGQAVIVPYWVARSARQFHALVQQAGITVLNQTPSAFLPLIEAEQDLDSRLASLRWVIFGGERLEPAALARWLAWRGQEAPRLVNMYGITETTVHVTAREVELADTQGEAPSLIGAPLSDLQLYVLDTDLNPVPAGVFGELCVGGAGLARGYLGQPALTASRFVADPFGPPGARLYRSGDIARRLRNGELEYQGRNDGQVKIRGFRIEPGEIRAALLQHPGVRSAVVVARPDAQAGQRLIGYLVGEPVPLAELREHLGQRLPAHMLPSAFVWLQSLPLTVNGKLDTRALPDPLEQVQRRACTPPESAEERALAAIWQEVLGDVTPGLDDDFFELGGHSLSAVKVITRVRERLNLNLALQEVFNWPTLRAFAAAMQAAAQASGHHAAPLPAIAPRSTEQALPLSLAQERLWVLWQLEPASCAYHVPGAVRLSGAVDAARVRQAFAAIVARHEALRTTFVQVDGQPQQRIGGSEAFEWRCQAIDATGPGALDDALRGCVARPFDLEHGPLLRVWLLSTGPGEHVLAVVMHHIIADGGSLDLLIDEFCTAYQALCHPREVHWPVLPIQCADHALWERSEGARQAADLAWWVDRLGTDQPLLELPLARARGSVRSAAGGRCLRQIEGSQAQRLRHLAQTRGTTLFTTLLAVYQALLHRYSGQDDLRIGIPVANRERLELENLIGFFTNTLVIRASVSGAQGFEQLLADTREQVLAAQAHASVPFAQLVDALQPQRELGLSPLFQTMFNLQVTPQNPFAALRELRVTPLDLPALGGETAQFDLTLDITDNGETLRVAFGYASDVLERSTVDTLADHFVELLGQILAQPSLPIGALTLSTPTPVRALALAHDSVPARFARQALARPQAPALRAPGTPASDECSYAELERQAGAIAARLYAAGVGRETRVGLCVERSPAMVAALLGIWRAGAAFVPLDPDYPPERLAYMVADAAITHVVTDRASAGRLSAVLQGLTLHSVEQVPPGEPPAPAWAELPATALAYVMYTSGSTGAPKGVAMTHGALSVHMEDIGERFALQPTDRVLQFSTLNFDASLEQLLPALCVGACVVLRGAGLWSWPEFNAVMATEAVTVTDLPTAFWQQWLRDLPPALPALRLVTIGGEALNGAALAQWRASGLGAVRLDNTYGPTEAAISAMSRQTCAVDEHDAVVTLGTAYPGRAVHVLDPWGNPLPDGAVGELCIGGQALARGYWARAAATAERFVPDPFGAPGARMYRTGDLCRVRVGDRERVLDYLGRGDRQVKLRGYRVELADVETAVRALPHVSEALALIHGEGDARRLHVYAVAPAGTTAATLLAQLAERLPGYLLPSAMTVLDVLPLTPNGKIDKRALPPPNLDSLPEQRSRTAARDAREAQLLSIWCAVLGRRDIGVDDNFFALGGDSIQAIQAVSRARQGGMTLSVRDLFEFQTVAALALRIPQPTTLRPYREVAGPVPLTPIQQWFFAEHPQGLGHWNQSVLLAADQRLAWVTLQEVLAAVMSRHDALRLRFARDPEGVWQAHSVAVDVGATPHCEHHDLSHDEAWPASLQALGAQVQASLDIEQGPLWRAALFDLPQGASRLLLVVHHLAIDGVSWRIVLEELALAWAQRSAGQPVQLPARSLSWGEWSQAQALHARSPAVLNERAAWQRQLAPTVHWDADRRARGGLPLAMAPGTVDCTLGASRVLRRQLDRRQTQALLHQATASQQCRMDELLLGALTHTLARWVGGHGVLLELEGHGREEVIEGLDLTRTVGWFTSRYPLWLASREDLAQTLVQVRNSLRSVPHKGMHYGLLEVSSQPEVRAAMAQLPRAQVSFNYLGQFGQDEAPAGPLRIATGEQAGAAASADSHCAYALEMNALVVDGGLSIDWRYLPMLIDTATAEALMDVFYRHLQDLVPAEDAAPAPGFASDVQGEDLDALLGLMDD